MRHARPASLVLALAACGDSTATTPNDDTGTDGTTSISTSTSTSTSESADSTTTDATTSAESGTEATDDTSDTTGGVPGPEGVVELLFREDYSSDTPGFFLFRMDGTVPDGPIATHDPLGQTWEFALQLSDRRVVYWLDTNPVSELRLGTLDEPLPAMTQPLDTVPAGVGVDWFPRAIPEADAIVYPLGGTLWRVDLNGLTPDPPVAVTDGTWDLTAIEPVIDPAGRYVVGHVHDVAEDTYDLVRASLTAPDPSTAEPLTNVLPGGSAVLPLLTATGDAGFFKLNEGVTDQLMYVELANAGAPAAVPVIAPVVEPAQLQLHPSQWDVVRPHPTAPGALVPIVEQPPGLAHIDYVGIEGGAPLPLVPLHDPTRVVLDTTWSPDGRWLALQTRAPDDTFELVLAQFGDDHDPVLTTVHAFAQTPPGGAVGWIPPDSRHLYFLAEPVGDGLQDLMRVALVEGDLMSPQLVIEGGGLPTFAPDGSKLLTTIFTDDAWSLYAIDISGFEPAEPALLDLPLGKGQSASWPRFSDSADYVAYETDDGLFGPYRLFVFHVDAPAVAVEVSGNVGRWDFVVEPRALARQ